MKDRPEQLIMMFFSMLECWQWEGILFKGKCLTLLRPLRQSDKIVTIPRNPGWTLFLARSSNYIAINPASPPLSTHHNCFLRKGAPHPPSALCALNDKGNCMNLRIKVSHMQTISHCNTIIVCNCFYDTQVISCLG